MLSSVSKLTKEVMCFMEKNMLGKFHLGMSYSVADLSSLLINQKYILNKASLNRNLHKRRLCINQLMKML